VSDRLASGDSTHPAVRVQAIFHVSSEAQAQTVAARMVDRAHEIANLPECECDVDVTIERTGPDAIDVSAGDAVPQASPPTGL
jgi:hypothetical protein